MVKEKSNISLIILFILSISSINYINAMQEEEYTPILPEGFVKILRNKHIKMEDHFENVIITSLCISSASAITVEGTLEQNGNDIKVYITLMVIKEFSRSLKIEDPQGKKHRFRIKKKNYFKLKNFSHKNILKIFDFIEIHPFFCIVHESRDNLAGVVNVVDDKKPNLWLRKKMMVSKTYSLMYLHSKDVFLNFNDHLLTLIDEFYNVKTGVFLQGDYISYDDAGENGISYFYQNIVFMLYKKKTHNKDKVSLIRKSFCTKDRSIFYDFCMYLIEKDVESKDIDKVNKFKNFLSSLDYEGEGYFEKIINNEFFRENILYITDFRKWKYLERKCSTFNFKHTKNKVVFEFIYKPEVIEIKFIENVKHIKLDSEMIHYRSCTITINGNILDIDTLDEENFKEFQKKVKAIFLEAFFYIDKKIDLEVYNDYFNFLFLETPGCYRMIYKKNNNDVCFDVHIKLDENDLTVIDIWESIPIEKRREFAKKVAPLIENLIENKEYYDSIKAKLSEVRPINSDKLVLPHNTMPALKYVFIPGLGIRKEEKGDDTEIHTRYFLDKYCIESKTGIRFYKVTINSDNIETTEEMQDHSEFIECVGFLLEASFVEVRF